MLIDTIDPQGASTVAASIPRKVEITDLPHASAYLDYHFTLDNYMKVVKIHKKFEKQLNAWAKQFEPFMDQIIAQALNPFTSLHACMNNMEKRVNNRLIEFSFLDLAKSMSE